MEQEIWKPIKGFEGCYEVSNLARIRTVGRTIVAKDGRIMYIKPHIHKPCKDHHGYYYVKLIHNGVQKNIRVHRAIMDAFVENPQNKPFIDHINTIRTDNRIENLMWVTSQENTHNQITLQRIKDACTAEAIARQIQTKKDKGVWNGRKVVQYTKDGVFVAEYDTILSAAKQFRKNPRSIIGNISCAIDKNGKSAYGYIWKSRKIEPTQ